MNNIEVITVSETDNKEFERKMDELLARRMYIDGRMETAVDVQAYNCGIMKIGDEQIPYWQAIVEITTQED